MISWLTLITLLTHNKHWTIHPLVVFCSVFCWTDKICDQISDAVLDAHLKQDPDAKVACGKSNSFPLEACCRCSMVFLFMSPEHLLVPFVFCALTETIAKTGMVLLAGEVTSRASVDYQKIVRDTIRHIGYDDSSKGLCIDTRVGLGYIHATWYPSFIFSNYLWSVSQWIQSWSQEYILKTMPLRCRQSCTANRADRKQASGRVSPNCRKKMKKT